MKVSVIVPVYNTEQYLRKCLNSLLIQTLDGVEIIAVNDGSTDGSAEILDQLQLENPGRMKVFHEKNSGQAVARNLALEHCSGEYIAFLDSDDWVNPDKFQILYEKAKETDADYVACGYRDTVIENGQEVTLNPYVASKPAKETKDLFFDALVTPILLMYRREVLLDHNVRYPEGIIYEDTSFYLNAIPFIHKIAVVEKPLGNRLRRRNSTMTICKANKVAQIFPALKDSIDFYKKNGFNKIYEKELEYFCVRILLCSSMGRIARVKSIHESWQLVKETLAFLENNFPDFRQNPYIRGGVQHAYMRSFCLFTAGFFFPFFRLRARFEKKYE